MSSTHPVAIDTHHVINVSMIPTPDIEMSPINTLELLNLHHSDNTRYKLSIPIKFSHNIQSWQ